MIFSCHHRQYEKETKVAKKKAYYSKLSKQPWGVLDAFPPRDRYEWERINTLKDQKWIRKFPPLAVCGEETYKRIKNHGQVRYCAYLLYISTFMLILLYCLQFYFLQ